MPISLAMSSHADESRLAWVRVITLTRRVTWSAFRLPASTFLGGIVVCSGLGRGEMSGSWQDWWDVSCEAKFDESAEVGQVGEDRMNGNGLMDCGSSTGAMNQEPSHSHSREHWRRDGWNNYMANWEIVSRARHADDVKSRSAAVCITPASTRQLMSLYSQYAY